MIRSFHRALVAGLAAVLLTTVAVAQDRPLTARSGQEPAVRRTTLLVEDMEKSIDFYQRLGMTKIVDQVTQDSDAGGVIGAADLPLTSEPKRGRLVVMKGNDERNGMIGLLGYERPPLASARSNLIGLGTGDIVITVEVIDLQGVYANLQQIGTRFHRTPGPYAAPGADGATQRGRRMFVYDPDGHMLEILQPDRR